MFVDNKIIFAEKNILKSDTLQVLESYPRELINLMYSDFSDGIICGARVTSAENYKLIVSPGIIKYKGIIYHMNEKAVIPYRNDKNLQFLRIRFLDEEETAEGIKRGTEFVISTDTREFPYELEIARFISERGANMIIEGSSMEELALNRNHIDVKFAKYSTNCGDTISPYILKVFVEEYLKKMMPSEGDMAFCLQVLNGKNISRDAICAYISYKTKSRKYNLNNEEIYLELLNILRTSSDGGNVYNKVNRNERRNIIVD